MIKNKKTKKEGMKMQTSNVPQIRVSIVGHNANCIQNIAIVAQAALALGYNCKMSPKHNIRPYQDGIMAAKIAM